MSGGSAGAAPDGAGEPERAEEVCLRDGTVLTIRVLVAGDEPALREFLAGLGLEARRLRFFTGGADIDTIARSIAVTGPGRIGVLALTPQGAIVGHALCASLDGDETAEVAVEVADDLHGRGLGTVLLERLAELAEGRGIRTLVATVLPDNAEMLDVFRDAFAAELRFQEGTEQVRFPAAAWRAARERYPQPFLRPGSISPRSSA